MMAADAVRCRRRGAGSSITWSSSDKDVNIALSDGDAVASKTGGYRVGVGADSAAAKSSGKWYVEFAAEETLVDSRYGVGLSLVGASRSTDLGMFADSAVYRRAGNIYVEGVYATGTPYPTGSIIGMLVDFDGSTVDFSLNGAPVASVAMVLDGGSYVPAFSAEDNGTSVRIRSESEFSYSVPAGANAWGAA